MTDEEILEVVRLLDNIDASPGLTRCNCETCRMVTRYPVSRVRHLARRLRLLAYDLPE